VSPNDRLSQRPTPARRRGWGAIVVGIIGVILLLPGLCALGFIVNSGFDDLTNGGLIVLWLICFAIAFAGGVLIWNAAKW
jgi:hypothetical protein